VVQGYEKPRWFTTDSVHHESPGWSHNESHLVVAEECKAVTEQVGVIDLSGSAKYRVTGKDAASFLEHLSCNRIPHKNGRIGLTLFHAPEGGIMCEMSVTRLDDEEFYLVSGIGSEHKDLHWMQSNRQDYDVEISNVTDDLGVLLVTGPHSRALLQEMTEEDLSNATFPWLSAKTVLLDSTEMTMIRVSYAGELGFELHMQDFQLLSIYDSLYDHGEKYGLRDFGSYALNAMRLEKKYPAYGSEFTEEVSGLEAGMSRFIQLDRDFIGADNLRDRQKNGFSMSLAYLIFDDDIACECQGNEAVYHNGRRIGLTTSGAFGYRTGKSIAFAYLSPDQISEGLQVSIETAVGTRQAHIENKPVYDPANEKLRG